MMMMMTTTTTTRIMMIPNSQHHFRRAQALPIPQQGPGTLPEVRSEIVLCRGRWAESRRHLWETPLPCGKLRVCYGRLYMETMAHWVRGFEFDIVMFHNAIFCYSLPIGGKKETLFLCGISHWIHGDHPSEEFLQVFPTADLQSSKMARIRSLDSASWDLHGSMTAWPTHPARCVWTHKEGSYPNLLANGCLFPPNMGIMVLTVSTSTDCNFQTWPVHRPRTPMKVTRQWIWLQNTADACLSLWVSGPKKRHRLRGDCMSA